MGYYRDYTTLEIFYYLLPVISTAYFSGHGGIQSFELLYVGLIDFGIGSFLFCGFLVVIGFISVFSGATPREAKKKVITEDMIFMTNGQRFTNVFGKCGMLHFLCPFLPFPNPRVDEGYRRIITYNSDRVVDGLVITTNFNDSNDERFSLLDNAEP